MGDHYHEKQGRNDGANGLNLPPGFRFHPSDEEIITSYLKPKVLDNKFTTLAFGEADLNKLEPWELTLMENMGEKVGYFYYQRDRKYPTGPWANRATESGYWKSTGKDKKIYQGASMGPVPLGMKKTLVFYKGRAPKGAKTNWVMHEYRLPYHEEWVVCRVFHKCSGIKKAPDFTSSLEESYGMTVGTKNNFDLSAMSFIMLTQFPMQLEDFTKDLSVPSFHFTNGMSLPSTELSPMIDISSMGLQMNYSNHFGDMISRTQPDSFYQQVGVGTSSNFSFMAEHSIPPPMLSHDIRPVSAKNNDVGIS